MIKSIVLTNAGAVSPAANTRVLEERFAPTPVIDLLPKLKASPAVGIVT